MRLVAQLLCWHEYTSVLETVESDESPTDCPSMVATVVCTGVIMPQGMLKIKVLWVILMGHWLFDRDALGEVAWLVDR
jgi:hypothetical protein